MIDRLLFLFVLLPALVLAYAYLGYPLALMVLGWWRPRRPAPGEPEQWPTVSITVPAYNEEDSIRATIERLLAVDYPRDRLQLVVVSDASSDGTDAIVQEYADQGVELVRCEQRSGKTGAENNAIPHLRGDIVINTDASVQVPPQSIRPLVAAFQDSTVGVASGFDVSTSGEGADHSEGESRYVGYEMWVRSLETHLGSIVGASGCLYAIRRSLHATDFPASLSRDFAAALIARQHGYRAVSVPEAICFVPRSSSLRREFRRKVRTMARGLQTLWFKRRLLNPFRYGLFAFMLFSHKLARWLLQPVLLVSGVGLVLLAPWSPVAAAVASLGLAGLAMGWWGWTRASRSECPRWLTLAGFAVSSNLAALIAWGRFLRGTANAVWEPTRRPAQTDSRESSPRLGSLMKSSDHSRTAC